MAAVDMYIQSNVLVWENCIVGFSLLKVVVTASVCVLPLSLTPSTSTIQALERTKNTTVKLVLMKQQVCN